ncbi:MAG TPA: hypothetical protein VE684_16520 [Crenalkalicoccus sp.]|jgi:hypothetical protein|nr:hypothetical protein [Crenalkalicoccus sp.]
MEQSAIGASGLTTSRIGEVEGWHLDEASRQEIDAILQRCIADLVSPAFTAPPQSRGSRRRDPKPRGPARG